MSPQTSRSLSLELALGSLGPSAPSQSSDTIALAPGTAGLMQVSRQPKLPLPSGAQALIKWAEQRGLRPLSFTATAVANLFKLRLREPGKSDQ